MRRTAVLIILGLILAACQARTPDPGAEAASRAIFERVSATPAPGAQPEADQSPAAKLKANLPAGKPVSSKLVRFSAVALPKGGRADTLIYQYDYANDTALFTTVLTQAPGAKTWGLHDVRLVVASHKELAPNALSLGSRSPAQLAVFGLALASPVLMLFALVKVLRTPELPYRWLWCLFALIGVFDFQINWATGHAIVQWTSVQVFGFWMWHGVSRFEPWLIQSTLPIGALLLLAGVVGNPAGRAKAA